MNLLYIFITCLVERFELNMNTSTESRRNKRLIKKQFLPLPAAVKYAPTIIKYAPKVLKFLNGNKSRLRK